MLCLYAAMLEAMREGQIFTIRVCHIRADGLCHAASLVAISLRHEFRLISQRHTVTRTRVMIRCYAARAAILRG